MYINKEVYNMWVYCFSSMHATVELCVVELKVCPVL